MTLMTARPTALPMILRAGIAALLITLSPLLAHAQDHPPSTEAANFDVFVRDTAAICLSRPSAACVDSGWLFADRDSDQRLSTAEVQGLRQDLGEWFSWRAPTLTNRERNALSLGMLVIDSMGIDQILSGFDTDRDGAVTRPELLADITLDDRPLGTVLTDPAAVDRAALARRFGPAAALLPELPR